MLPCGTEDVAGEVLPEALLTLALLALSFGIPSAWFGLRWLKRGGSEPLQGSPATTTELILAVPVLIISQVAAASILVAIFGAAEVTPPLAGLLAVPAFLLPLTMLATLRARRVGGWGALGLGPGAFGHIPRALFAWLLFLPLLYGLVWASPAVYGALGFDWAPQAHGEGIASLQGLSLLLAAALAVLVIPFLEELVFRGWMQQGLARLLGPRMGLLLPALLFTINHDPSVWPPILVLALLLGALRERTQGLWPCVAVHVAHNGLQVLLLGLGMHLQ